MVGDKGGRTGRLFLMVAPPVTPARQDLVQSRDHRDVDGIRLGDLGQAAAAIDAGKLAVPNALMSDRLLVLLGPPPQILAKVR